MIIILSERTEGYLSTREAVQLFDVFIAKDGILAVRQFVDGC